MLTKWAKKLVGIPKSTDYILGLTSNQKSCIIAKDAGGTTRYLGHINVSQSVNLLTSITATGSDASYGIAVGSSDTPATDEDYTIGTLISTLTTSATPTVSSTYDTTTGKYKIFVDLTLSNATASDIIVKEVCRFTKTWKADSLGSSINTQAANGVCVLMDRTVLDTPLTVPAGESAVLRYSYDYQMDAATT